MVAQTVTLPNVKKMFTPDPGYVIYDIDLAQADAQVVAWEANDSILKEIFRDPERDLHDENSYALFNHLSDFWSNFDYYRKQSKAGVHATNYLVTAPTLATTLGISRAAAQEFIDFWFELHPGIAEWHDRIELSLATNRTVTNPFGASITFFDRTPTLMNEAVAWIPQSTVGTVINKGILNVHNNMRDDVQLLLQVHDSSAGQFKKELLQDRDFMLELKSQYEIVVPYDDPLIIGVGIEVSDKSWGDCKAIPWPEAA